MNDMLAWVVNNIGEHHYSRRRSLDRLRRPLRQLILCRFGAGVTPAGALLVPPADRAGIKALRA